MIVTESKKIFIKSPMFTFYSAIIGWYISSALCNASTKILLQTLPIPYSVSILQFFLAYQWSNVVWKWTSNPKLNIAVDQRKMLFLMSISYTIGFILVNTGFHLMHVSINETLRAAEPLFSVLLMTCSMTTQISRHRVLTLLPIVFGVGLSSYQNQSITMTGFLVVMAANVAFAVRSILTKTLRMRYKMNHIELLNVALQYGTCMQCLVGGTMALSDSKKNEAEMENKYYLLILFNGFCFYAYNQLSVYVLSESDVLTHSIANAFRRIVTISSAVLYFNQSLSLLNVFGMLLATGGVISYAKVVQYEQPSITIKDYGFKV